MRSNLRRLKTGELSEDSAEYQEYLGRCATSVLMRMTSIKETPRQKKELDIWEKTLKR